MNITLPSTHDAIDGLQCLELYQQTEVWANPLQHSNEDLKSGINDYNVKFTIGDEICSGSASEKEYCNGPLPINQKYGVMARVFTSSGFRDTSPIYIELLVNPLQLIAPATIVYASVTVLVLLSLVILLCCVCRGQSKKKKEALKKRQAAEADENLLSFTSYCVIDKNPLPRKSYGE